MRLSPYDTYCTYLAVKNHFTQEKYDFFKYNGKVKVPVSTFENRRDRIMFEQLSKKYMADDMVDVIVSNMLADNTYVDRYIHEEGRIQFQKYRKIKESLTYTFTSDIERALLINDDIKYLFKPGSNGYPEVMNLYMQHVVTLQTIVILEHFVQFLSKYEAKLKGDFIWDKFLMKVRKYSPFLIRGIDQKKYAETLKKLVDTHK
jgi:T4 gene Gp59 loader of gp41 DNA helicase